MPFYYDFNVPHDNAYLRAVRRIYHPLGFKKGYNFPLWVILGGAMFGFGLSRMMFYNFNHTFRAEALAGYNWGYFSVGHGRIGILLHLATVLPACILVPWQFVPVIRAKLLLFHRLNGYACALLLLLGNVGALMIARHSMNGSVTAQLVVGILAIYTTSSLVLAYVNIKRQQLDQHRAWMLRAWIVAGSIITARLAMLAIMDVTARMGDYYLAVACENIAFLAQSYGMPVQAYLPLYPTCGADPNAWAAVRVDRSSANPQEISAAVAQSFGPATLIALALHVFGVELYLRLTPAEGERLRRISYERQLARGWRNPGSASGLTVQTWGDAEPWSPVPVVRREAEGREEESTGEESEIDKGVLEGERVPPRMGMV